MRIDTTKTIMILHRDQQQTVLTGKLLEKLLISRGYGVISSGLCNMDTQTHCAGLCIHFGSEIPAIIDSIRKADFILSSDFAIAIRCLQWLKPGGRLISHYREGDWDPSVNCSDRYLKEGYNIDAFDASSMASSVGEPAMTHMVLLGRLSWYFDIADTELYSILSQLLPESDLDSHCRAYRLGKKNYGKIFHTRD